MPLAIPLGFAMYTERFRNALRLPTLHPSRPHPCLIYAVYLHGARISEDQSVQKLQDMYLQRAILSLQDAIGGSSSVDVR